MVWISIPLYYAGMALKMKHGARPTRIKHTDYDFLKTQRFAGVSPTFVDEFFADAGLTMPNQNAPESGYVPPVPPLPFGCTDYGQSELATDLTKTIHNPNDLEAITHANVKYGIQIRDSLDACLSPSLLHPERLGWIKRYYNIRAQGRIDSFDAFRLAQVLGLDVGEKRSITWGTPWFPSWEAAIFGNVIVKQPDGSYSTMSGGERKIVMPMPTDAELALARAWDPSIPWHDSKLDGWTKKNGTVVYRDKSWQGNEIGEGGFIYFPREVINTVMGIPGTVAYVASNLADANAPQTIDISTLQWIVSWVRVLLQRYVG